MDFFNSGNTDELLMNCIYGYYVKYEQLSKLININFAGSNATTLDIFIDYDDICSKVISKMNTPGSIPPINKLFITAGIVNMCGHYREFFRRYYKTYTRFWILHSEDIKYHSLQYKEFKRKDITSNKNIIDENINILSTLCLYLPDIQFISTSGFENAVIAANIIKNERSLGNGNPVLYITKDYYNYLLAAEIQNTFILRPKKTKDGDVSELISFESSYVAYVQSVFKSNPSIILPPTKLGAFMALTKVPSRGLKSLCRIGTAEKGLYRAITDGMVPVEYVWDLESLFEETKLNIDIYQAIYRFKALDIIYNESAYTNTIHPNYTGIVNLYDPNSVKQINDKYFRNIPLDLEVI